MSLNFDDGEGLPYDLNTGSFDTSGVPALNFDIPGVATSDTGLNDLYSQKLDELANIDAQPSGMDYVARVFAPTAIAALLGGKQGLNAAASVVPGEFDRYRAQKIQQAQQEATQKGRAVQLIGQRIQNQSAMDWKKEERQARTEQANQDRASREEIARQNDETRRSLGETANDIKRTMAETGRISAENASATRSLANEERQTRMDRQSRDEQEKDVDAIKVNIFGKGNSDIRPNTEIASSLYKRLNSNPTVGELGNITNLISRAISDERGNMSDKDIGRTFLETMNTRIAKIQADYGSDPSIPVPPESLVPLRKMVESALISKVQHVAREANSTAKIREYGASLGERRNQVFSDLVQDYYDTVPQSILVKAKNGRQ